MPHYNFKKDLPIAIATEIEIAELLKKIYNATILAFEHTNKYDILVSINGKEYTFEAKEDFTCERTGNVGIEYSCRGKPSGIEVSQADYYLYKLHTKDYGIQFILHSTRILKRKIENKEYFRTVNGGDPGSNSLNYLFKYDVFIQGGRILPLDRI